MSGGNGHGGQEIIIIKRHAGGHEEGAHGGAWKIAYADFMTAMMAFFLVMWLVNAANEETKASMASYFNPIKLSDKTPAEKGLENPVNAESGEQASERSQVEADEDVPASQEAEGRDKSSSAGKETEYSEADFFENPYSVLAEIAQEVGQQANVSARGEGGASLSGPSTGAEGGEAWRDPFDPDFWSRQVELARTEKNTGEPAMLREAAAEPKKPADAEKAAEAARMEAAKADAGTAPAAAGEREDQQSEAALKAEAGKLGTEIRDSLAALSGKLAEGVEVSQAEGGVLVTISDQGEEPMFDVGSAVPRRDMVLAMERIGTLLKDRPGAILVRGHTDARPFRDGANDNWRLSMARAHSAYHMLVHGGIAEQRIVQVSGFADRRLKLPQDPMAAANRRIEILIQVDGG